MSARKTSGLEHFDKKCQLNNTCQGWQRTTEMKDATDMLALTRGDFIVPEMSVFTND